VARSRTHRDGCGIAHAADLLSERWALVVIRELLLGPKRFTDLRTGIPDISPNVLGQRLRELEESGIVRRRKLPPPAAARVYELTDWGQELEPAVLALGRWATHSDSFLRDAEIGSDSIVLAIKAAFDEEAAAGLNATYGLEFGEEAFRIEVADGELTASRGEAEDPDALVHTDPDTMAALVFRGKGLGKAVEDGAVRIDGSRRAVNALLRTLT
jgi:DNA-binding HxlR family transcriptional regulator